MKKNNMYLLLLFLVGGLLFFVLNGSITGLFIGQPNEKDMTESTFDNFDKSIDSTSEYMTFENKSADEEKTDSQKEEGEKNTTGSFEEMNNETYAHPLEGQKINWYYDDGFSSSSSGGSSSSGNNTAIPEFSSIIIPLLTTLFAAGMNLRKIQL